MRRPFSIGRQGLRGLAPDVKKPAAGDTSQRAFTLSKERTFPPRNASVRRLRLSAAPIE